MTVCGQLDRAVVASPGGAPSRELASVLAGVVARDEESGPPPVPVSARDVVVVVTGGTADHGPLVAEAGLATIGVAVVVDPAPGPPVTVVAPVTVLRGPGSVELLALWDSVVAGW